jgi:hypothetical protein
VTKLTEVQRAKMPKSAFAYIDSQGRRRLPIYDEPHVRAALGRFNQVVFESDAAREQARTKLLRAARRHGLVPVGFIEGQLRKERTRGQADTVARRSAALPVATVTFLMTDVQGSTSLLAELGEGYGPMLSDVRRLIREKVRKAGGHEVEVHGDEYLAVFASAPAALEAAILIQRRMVGSACIVVIPRSPTACTSVCPFTRWPVSARPPMGARWSPLEPPATR